MSRGLPELPAGTKAGPYVVKRPTQPDRHGRERYVVTTTCCQQELIRGGYYLRKQAPKLKACAHCNTRKQVEERAG